MIKLKIIAENMPVFAVINGFIIWRYRVENHRISEAILGKKAILFYNILKCFYYCFY
jgi:hypothetical protein